MMRLPTRDLARYLLNGQLPRQGCLVATRRPYTRLPARSVPVWSRASHPEDARATYATATPDAPPVPLRKKLKEEKKQLKKESGSQKPKGSNQTVEGWELTVGIEIHAQLNTARKLFSPAATSFNDDPNSHVALFDVAMPGSQPKFQKETLIPALRAACALNCDIQPVSRFDRKHYFWWDQPAGYQITQYYEPFARNGRIELTARDGIAAEDGEGVTIGIQQIQLEQDTAKTLAQPNDVSWLDFNRVGTPLIEIITKPELHHPRTAAVFVRKVQALLHAVDACVSGMETGGLRADVNVSVRRAGDPDAPLGTRTEIKNLSTIKAVEDAIVAERDRQIAALEAGGVIASETRGWTLGSKHTRRLRGKEGEVDYRYMPDPDLGPLVIGEDLVGRIRDSVGDLPDAELTELIRDYGLTAKDAQSLMSMDDGGRLEYFYKVVGELGRGLAEAEPAGGVASSPSPPPLHSYAPLACNWILHEFGRLSAHKDDPQHAPPYISPDGRFDRLPHTAVAEILVHLHRRAITGRVAKELLVAAYVGVVPSSAVTETIREHDLWFKEMTGDEYRRLAERAVEGEDKVLEEFRAGKKKYPQGKLMYLVGKMMREGDTERIDPSGAEGIMRQLVRERTGAHQD
ncbi:Glutamyl-tRNA(Gln) amidotransferase subunit B, mitochondrial [Colletotrichum tanaceti]|uniref:Glutamyl-tRNA(Gln) amidotransferase subunit B, mitochondrial n=1 Tax=Colletotrichum tanaceti TaxID=1306861 RepID=A0A4U6XHI6_9PEZI|nr:Glutamyl-tRNA(Gln) amidotransferase subunit B, mitochondrial [Colletotrichum tanaceti]TKW55265.1 Glutamyl-tRNA(Gln) amidotransferase subunit B, mitochondrial [Colletotrichum tanaceti]